jgi:hypothetical protein
MNSRNVVAILICALLLISAAYVVNAQAGQAEARKQVQAWEHLALSHDGAGLGGGLGKQIIRLGDEGWQLVTVSNIEVDGTTKRSIYYFKRPK